MAKIITVVTIFGNDVYGFFQIIGYIDLNESVERFVKEYSAKHGLLFEYDSSKSTVRLKQYKCLTMDAYIVAEDIDKLY